MKTLKLKITVFAVSLFMLTAIDADANERQRQDRQDSRTLERQDSRTQERTIERSEELQKRNVRDQKRVITQEEYKQLSPQRREYIRENPDMFIIEEKKKDRDDRDE